VGMRGPHAGHLSRSGVLLFPSRSIDVVVVIVCLTIGEGMQSIARMPARWRFIGKGGQSDNFTE